MNCPICGASAAAPGLKYCNQCGAALSGTQAARNGFSQSKTLPESLIWAIVAVFTIGLGCTIGLMAVMKNVLNFSPQLLVVFSALSFFLTFATEAVLIWMLLSRTRQADQAAAIHHAQFTGQTASRLEAAPQRALTPESVPSITEHTTRAFEPIYDRRKTP